MTVDFTKVEYRLLIDLLAIGDWVLHAHKTGEPKETQPYRDLMQKVFSFSKEMEAEDWCSMSPS